MSSEIILDRSRTVTLAASEGRSTPEFLSAHPSPQTRIEELARHIQSRGY